MENNECIISRWQLIKQQLNNLEPEDFMESYYRHPEAVLIDVRTPREFSEGHLDGAVNIDYFSSDFWERIEQLDQSNPCFVYCRSERRSLRTCRLMENGGFLKVYNLSGGLKAMNLVS